MAVARAHAIALVGVEGHVVEIEADIENGLVALLLVGLPDAALREARDRIRAAVINSGHPWPLRRITFGLSSASPPKRSRSVPVLVEVDTQQVGGVLADAAAGITLPPVEQRFLPNSH